MSTQCPSAILPTDNATPQRSALLVVHGGRDIHGTDTPSQVFAAEVDALLGQLEGTVGRLALAHRSDAPDIETQITDDDAFAWVQQSIEDIAATLRGLGLGRSGKHLAEGSLRALADLA